MLMAPYDNMFQTVSGSHFEVVVDVTDESDVAHPLLQRAPSRLLAVLELLLEPVQQVPPEHISVVLLGLGLHQVNRDGRKKRVEC